MRRARVSCGLGRPRAPATKSTDRLVPTKRRVSLEQKPWGLFGPSGLRATRDREVAPGKPRLEIDLVPPTRGPLGEAHDAAHERCNQAPAVGPQRVGELE